MNNGLLGFPRGQLNGGRASPRRTNTPAQISALTLWLDAGKITGLADNDPLTTWTDLSPYQFFFSGTSTTRPIYRTNQINGLPAVSFNGSTQFMTSNAPAPQAPFTVFAVVRGAGTAGNFISATSLGGFLWCYFSSKYQVISSSISLVGQSTSSTDTGAHVLSFRFASGAWQMEKDGIPDGSGTSGVTLATSRYALGYDAFAGGSFWNGIIAEIICYNRLLANAEYATVMSYLKTKYSI